MADQFDPNKRVRFFDGQVLKADDLTQEQFYHLQRRQLHTSLLHTPGVAKDLVVTGAALAATITVGKGIAINAKGQEIVLDTDTPVALTGLTGVTKAEVYLVFAAAETDAPSGGAPTRVTEKSAIVVRKVAPAAAGIPEGVPDGGVLLAELALDGTGKLTGTTPVNSAVRARAGVSVGDDLTVRSIVLKRDGVASAQWPRLSCSAASQTELTGGLRVTGDGMVAGNLGVGTMAPGAKLHVVGGDVRWGNNSQLQADQGGSVELGGNSTTPGSGTPYIDFHFSGLTQDFNTRIINDANGRLSIVAGTLFASGNVGVGAPAPVSRLQVTGDLAIQSMGAGAARALPAGSTLIWNDATWLRLNQNLDFSKPIFGVHTPGVFAPMSLNVGGASGWGDPGGGNAWITGSVGVGTATPADRVDVAGTLRILTGSNPIRFTAGWTGFPDPTTNQAEISNDTGTFKTLMIVGNKSAGVGRRVSIWDRLEVNGVLQVNGTLIAPTKSGCVVDQFVNRLGEALEGGDVVVIGASQPTLYYGVNKNIPIPEVDLARRAYDARVCGVVAEVYAELAPPEEGKRERGTRGKRTTAEGGRARTRVRPEEMQVREFAPDELNGRDRTKVEPDQIGFMVTLGAYAHCKVDADIAPIQIGDLLTTSPTKGHAQKVLDPSKAVGAILGKALGSLKKGKGEIPLLVILQ